jgi:Double zinc ribbon
VRERELEMQAAEARLGDMDFGLCPHCDYRVERDFLRCPSCLRKLKERCASCARPLDQSWTICPYCEAEVAGAVPARSTRRRRSSASTPEEPPAERPATSSRRRQRAAETQTLPAEDMLAVESSSLSNGLDSALDVDLLGETVESDQLTLADQDGSDAAAVPGSSRVPPAPARPRRRSQRPTS